MSSFPSFPLFYDPVGEKSFEQRESVCAGCGKSQPWTYVGPQYGEGELDEPLCPWCIADGSAAAKLKRSFNDATMYPCTADRPRFTAEDEHLVEHCTPGFTTWQGNHWMLCCGRACVYIGEAKAGDLLPGGRWESAVRSVIDDWDEREEEERQSIVRDIGHGSVCAYIFRCRVCGELRGFWDCD